MHKLIITCKWGYPKPWYPKDWHKNSFIFTVRIINNPDRKITGDVHPLHWGWLQLLYMRVNDIKWMKPLHSNGTTNHPMIGVLNSIYWRSHFWGFGLILKGQNVLLFSSSFFLFNQFGLSTENFQISDFFFEVFYSNPMSGFQPELWKTN